MYIRFGTCCRVLPAMFVLFAAANAAAQIPKVFNVQGRLAQPNGAPVPDGTKSIRFTLWDDATGGDQIWTSLLNVPVRNGVFEATLGAQDPFPISEPDDVGRFSSAFLEIRVGGDLPMAPRLPLTPVPAALRAATVDDGAISSSAKIRSGVINSDHLADGAITGPKLAAGTITNDKLASTFTTTGPAGGDLAGAYPDPELRTRPTSLAKVSGGLMAVGAGGASVDQSQTNHNGEAYVPRWQSFTPSRTGFLSGLDIYAGSRDASSHTATLDIYAGEGISGSPLATRNITIAAAPAFQHYDLDTPLFVQAGQKLTWQVTNYSNIRVGYYPGPGDGYTGGRSDNPMVDYTFRTYMSDGTIGIGTAPTPSARLNIVDPGMGTSGLLVGAPANVASGSNAKVLIAQTSNTGQWPFEIDRAGTILYGIKQDGTIFSASSRRLKENIAPLTNALETAMKLQAVTFDWKPEFGGGHDIGLVAEDTAEAMPELAVRSRDGKETIGVRYDRLGVLAIEAIQQQQAIIARQQEQIAALQERLSALERQSDGPPAPR